MPNPNIGQHAANRRGQSQPCDACRQTASTGSRGTALHSCENFPLPGWAGEYLAAVDGHLAGTLCADIEAVLARVREHGGGAILLTA